MTKFSFEVPLAHLEDFHDLQDYYFTLSKLYNKEKYIRFMSKVRSTGLHTMWLDNSYNEKMVADDPYELIETFNSFRLDRIIAPDDPSWDANKIALEFVKVAEHIGEWNTICVVSSPLMMEYMITEYGAKNFALSYWVRPKLSEYSLSQMRSCHFLGLLSVPEIMKYKPPSCDTSMPIKLAMQRKSLMEWAHDGYPHVHTKDLGSEGDDFFNMKMTNEQVTLARDNIKRLKEACNG
jgi:hypothetical protein